MLERVFHRPVAIARIRQCYLNQFIDDYSDLLVSKGYGLGTIHNYINAVEHFSRWLENQHASKDVINTKLINKFICSHLPSCRCPMPAIKNIPMVRAALMQLIQLPLRY